jgi:4-amino-4-deoxy-L-arabinose transferase-like glycosyltransferase
VFTGAGRSALMHAARNAYTMPGYPAFLAAAWTVFGVGAQRWLVARVLQALLSVATAGLVFLIGKRFSPRAGLISLVFMALYPPLTLANSYLLTEVLYTFLLAACVWTMLRWYDTRSAWLAFATGLTFAVGLWVRPAMAPWILVAALIALACAKSGRRQVFVQLVVMALAVVLVMSPWWVRNYGLYHHVVILSTSSGITELDALNRDFSEQLRFPWETAEPTYSKLDRAISARVLRAMSSLPAHTANDLAADAYYGGLSRSITLELAKNHPGEVARMRARSVATSLVWPSSVSPTAVGGYPFLLSWVLHLVLMALFVVGAIVVPKRFDVWLLLSLPLFAIALFALLIPIARYYDPVTPFILLIAAVGVDRFWPRRHPRSG